MKTQWIRYRFQANYEDFRPVVWPPLGPYWCTGYAGDSSFSIVVAYLPKGEDLLKFWPEAKDVDQEDRDEILFTDRFAQPEWWPIK